MAAEEVAENGLDIVAQASVVMADDAPPASRRKTSWKTKYLTLKAKCDQLDQANDVLYAKSRQICKMIQRAENEKRVLMHHLEQYEVDAGELVSSSSSVMRLKMADAFSPPYPSSLPHPSSLHGSIFTSPTPDPSETDFQTLRRDVALSPSPSTASTHPPPPTTSTTSNHPQPPPTKKARLSTPTRTNPSTPSSSPATKPSKKTPRGTSKSSPASRRKRDSDAGAPKKPSNAFFWFCQEQRGSLEEQFRGEGVAGQHSLTKILAQKWGETTTDDKKKYYVKYNEDKKRYEREMQAYHQKKHEQQMMLQKQLQQLSSSSTTTITHTTSQTTSVTLQP